MHMPTFMMPTMRQVQLLIHFAFSVDLKDVYLYLFLSITIAFYSLATQTL